MTFATSTPVKARSLEGEGKESEFSDATAMKASVKSNALDGCLWAAAASF